MMSPFFKYSLASAALALSLGAVSCTPDPGDPGVEYAPEMYESLPYEPLRQINYNKVNPFGINERDPAIATIPRGKLAFFDHIPKDSVDMAARMLRNPYPYTLANVQEGQVLYTRNCQHCHGENGDGQGPVGMKFKGVPNYSQGTYKTMNDGHIFHVIEWGRNRMMPHGSQVNPEERWKIAMYIHVLQIDNSPSQENIDKVVAQYGPKPTNDATKGNASVMTMGLNTKSEGAGTSKISNTPGEGGTKGRNGKM